LRALPGLKDLRLRNWDPFPVAPEQLEAVVLTHAHLDHCGYLPALVRGGFRGPVYCTPNTAALAAIVLPDSGRLQEEDAAYANRKGFSKHTPARSQRG
jgi:metallo-beta-lactamase family protein